MKAHLTGGAKKIAANRSSPLMDLTGVKMTAVLRKTDAKLSDAQETV